MSYVLIPGIGLVELATTAQLLPGALLIETAAASDTGGSFFYPEGMMRPGALMGRP